MYGLNRYSRTKKNCFAFQDILKHRSAHSLKSYAEILGSHVILASTPEEIFQTHDLKQKTAHH